MTRSPEGGAPGPESAQNGPSTDPGTGSARLVAAGILLSRVAGLIRDRVLAHYLGTSLFASAFRAGLRLPNVLQNLLGEGTLSASFIPVYSKLVERDRAAAGRLAGAVFALLVAVVGAFAVIGVTLAPALVRLFYPGYDGVLRDATVTCVRILFPMAGVLVLSAWALGILNSHRRFFVSYAAPVVWNAAIVAALLAFGGRRSGVDLIAAVSWGALIGGFLQFAVQLPWVLRLERSLRVRWDTDSAGVRQVLANAGPAILGRGVVQLSAYLDQFLASFLFAGAIATLGFAQTLYVLPVSLFGMSVAAAELPELARHGEQRVDALRTRIEAGLGRIAFLVMPAVAGYIVLGDVVVAALYQTGEFAAADTRLVHAVLAAYSVGLLASTGTRLYSSAFYALNDTRTPARFAFVRVTVAATLGLALMLWLERYAIDPASLGIVMAAGSGPDARPLGVAGLAIGTGIAAWLEWALLRRRLQARLGAVGVGRSAVMRLALAALVPAALCRVALTWAPAARPVLTAALVLPAFGAGYFLIARVLGDPHARALLDGWLARTGLRRPPSGNGAG